MPFVSQNLESAAGVHGRKLSDLLHMLGQTHIFSRICIFKLFLLSLLLKFFLSFIGRFLDNLHLVILWIQFFLILLFIVVVIWLDKMNGSSS